MNTVILILIILNSIMIFLVYKIYQLRVKLERLKIALEPYTSYTSSSKSDINSLFASSRYLHNNIDKLEKTNNNILKRVVRLESKLRKNKNGHN